MVKTFKKKERELISLVAITVLDKMETNLDLAAIVALRKWAKSSYYLSEWVFSDIKSEKQ